MDGPNLTYRTGALLREGLPGYFLLLPCSIQSLLFNANSVNPDQMPHSVVSDLGLRCLVMSLLWGVRHNWVNTIFVGN